MQTTKITHIAHLAEICAKKNIHQVVISPGSRNAPIVIAFDSHPAIETILIHDERSAAFFALGLAEATKKPVALTCTSGSAPLNYAPAIAEAYYRNIPLLILTADRPIELIDQGYGQTIRQKNVYANYIKAQFELPNYPDIHGVGESDSIVNQAINEAWTVPQGPVHINIPLAEPLYEVHDYTPAPVIPEPIELKEELSVEVATKIKKNWEQADRKMILIGQLPVDPTLIARLTPIINDPTVAVLVENTSNVACFHKFCHSIDRTLAAIKQEELEDFAPDLLITMGGAVISKRIKAYLRKHQPKVNYRVGIYPFEEDTFNCLTRSVEISPVSFLKLIDECEITNRSNFGNKWKQKDFIADERHARFLSSAPYSDLTVFDLILDTLPDESNLHMANSSVIRYCQLFNPIHQVHYYANRGVSGIDGSTSTAVGFAYANKKRLNTIITGDLSFMYDSNALWNNYLFENLRIIVINNGGGAIFKIIEGPAQSVQKDLFVAPISSDVQNICKAFKINYFNITSLADFDSVLADFYAYNENKRPALLEILTENVESEVVLKSYFNSISK
jgi:2-succinyl-5-enolpyruvyl-6-hydroxy-3-cyclohexene-1-carboxylate synthase